jgi:histone H3/H4
MSSYQLTKLLKSLHSQYTLSSGANHLLTGILSKVDKKLTSKAVQSLSKNKNSKSLFVFDGSFNMIGEVALGKLGDSFMGNTAYDNAKLKKKEKLDLVLTVNKHKGRISAEHAVFITRVLENIAKEFLLHAREIASDHKRTTIFRGDVLLTMSRVRDTPMDNNTPLVQLGCFAKLNVQTPKDGVKSKEMKTLQYSEFGYQTFANNKGVRGAKPPRASKDGDFKYKPYTQLELWTILNSKVKECKKK